MNTILLSASACLTAVGVTMASVSADTITAWVTAILNCVILVSNVGLQLYRQWRDKDKNTSGTVDLLTNSTTTTTDTESKDEEK